MKKILLFIVCAIGLLAPRNVAAQSAATFSPAADTIWATVPTTATVVDAITNLTGSSLNFKWRVISSNFPADWYTPTALGICDNNGCLLNTGYVLWNGTSGGFDSCHYGGNGAHDSLGDFHLQLDLTSASSGSHYLTISATDVTNGSFGGYSRTFTFVINKVGAAVSNVNNSESDVVLYPNPTTTDEVNLVYSPSADVKNIAVYNVIGKMMSVYKVADNTGANLRLDNMPSGIYFARLFNSHGDVVAIRKFTKQ